MDKRKKKNYKRKGLFLIFILGFLVAIYPIISNLYYRQVHTKEINSFIEGKDKLTQEEVLKKVSLAAEYNRTLDPSRLADPYTEKEKEGIAEYARMLEVEEKIGFVEIPKIHQNLPVFAGTSESILGRAAGHLEGTSLPIGGESTHAVITAHRGLPRAKLFRDLNELQIGDKFYFHNIETVLAYEVDQILTVEPWDFDPVLVVDGEDYMTLLTCTPYMINSHRLLVRGHRVEYIAPIDETNIKDNEIFTWYSEYLPYILLVVAILLFIVIYNYYSYRKTKKKLEEYNKGDE